MFVNTKKYHFERENELFPNFYKYIKLNSLSCDGNDDEIFYSDIYNYYSLTNESKKTNNI